MELSFNWNYPSTLRNPSAIVRLAIWISRGIRRNAEMTIHITQGEWMYGPVQAIENLKEWSARQSDERNLCGTNPRIGVNNCWMNYIRCILLIYTHTKISLRRRKLWVSQIRLEARFHECSKTLVTPSLQIREFSGSLKGHFYNRWNASDRPRYVP